MVTFAIVDELAKLHHSRLSIQGQRASSMSVTPNCTVTLALNDTLPTGNGQLRRAPIGSTPLVSWEFDVEIN
jgi:hypothetical protein